MVVAELESVDQIPLDRIVGISIRDMRLPLDDRGTTRTSKDQSVRYAEAHVYRRVGGEVSKTIETFRPFVIAAEPAAAHLLQVAGACEKPVLLDGSHLSELDKENLDPFPLDHLVFFQTQQAYWTAQQDHNQTPSDFDQAGSELNKRYRHHAIEREVGKKLSEEAVEKIELTTEQAQRINRSIARKVPLDKYNPTTQYLLWKSMTMHNPPEHNMRTGGVFMYGGMEFDELLRMQVDVVLNRRGHVNAIITRFGGEDNIFSGRKMVDLFQDYTLEKDPDTIEALDIQRVFEPIVEHAGRPIYLGRGGEAMKYYGPQVGVNHFSVSQHKARLYVDGRAGIDLAQAIHRLRKEARIITHNTPELACAHFGIDSGSLISRLDRLGGYLLPSSLQVAQVFPIGLAEAVTKGPATTVELEAKRRSIVSGSAIPQPKFSQRYEGARTAIFEQGLFEEVYRIDITAMYPSIFLSPELEMEHARDPLGLYREIIKMLDQHRAGAKERRNKSEAGSLEHTLFDLEQGRFKFHLNSFLGLLGAPYAHWNDPELIQDIVNKGRELITKIEEHLQTYSESHGMKLLELDTDGIYFTCMGDASEIEKTVNAMLPQGVAARVEGPWKGYFKEVKQYVLWDGEKCDIKGSGLRGSDIELFIRDFIRTAFTLLFQKKIDELNHEYHNLRERIMSGGLQRNEVVLWERCTQTAEAYAEKTSGGSNRQAHMEVAAKNNTEQGRMIGYFIRGRKANVTKYDHAVSIERFGRIKYNRKYYLHQFDEKVRNIFQHLDDETYQRAFMIDRREIVQPRKALPAGSQSLLFDNIYDGHTVKPKKTKKIRKKGKSPATAGEQLSLFDLEGPSIVDHH